VFRINLPAQLFVLLGCMHAMQPTVIVVAWFVISHTQTFHSRYSQPYALRGSSDAASAYPSTVVTFSHAALRSTVLQGDEQ